MSEAQKMAERQHQAEAIEAKTLPGPEACEKLQQHVHYRWFKQGAWQTFLKETSALGLTEEQKREEFESICKEFLQDDVKALVARGDMSDWQEVVTSRSSAEQAPAQPEA